MHYRSKMSLRFLSAAALLGVTAVAAAHRPVFADGDTTFLREFAKNGAKVNIVYSGPQALPIAQALEQTIRHNPDYKRGADGVRLLSLDEAQKADFGRDSVVVLLARPDLPAGGESSLPPAVSALVPFDHAELSTHHNVVEAVKDGKNATYHVALYATDTAHLRRIYEAFTNRHAANYRELPFLERHMTNRVNIFSDPADKPVITSANWGALPESIVWNEANWYPLSARDNMAESDLAEGTQVYFLDRSAGEPVPQAIRPLFANARPGASTVLALRGGTASGNVESAGEAAILPATSQSSLPTPPAFAIPSPDGGIYAVSAPSHGVLEAIIPNHATVRSLRQLPASINVLDLRGLAYTPLLVSTSARLRLRDPQTVSLTDPLAAHLGQSLGIRVASPGTASLSLAREMESPTLALSGESLRKVREKLGSQYVWLFRITDAAGSTRYNSETKSLTADMPPFSEPEPGGPTFDPVDPNSEDYKRAHIGDNSKHEKWVERKRDYDYRRSHELCEWSIKTTRTEKALAQGRLQLWDLSSTADSAVPIWETECAGLYETSELIRSDKVVVTGHDARPVPGDTGLSSDTFNEHSLNESLRLALQQASDRLKETALLPGDSANIPPFAKSAGDVPPPPGTAGGYRVTDNGSASAAPAPPVSPPPVSTAPSLPPGMLGKVADIDGRTITLTAGSAEGLKPGDKLEIALQVREIRDPDTNALRDIRVQKSITVRVVKSGTTADCVPDTTADAAKLAQVQAGMYVRRQQADSATGR